MLAQLLSPRTMLTYSPSQLCALNSAPSYVAGLLFKAEAEFGDVIRGNPPDDVPLGFDYVDWNRLPECPFTLQQDSRRQRTHHGEERRRNGGARGDMASRFRRQLYQPGGATRRPFRRHRS